MTDKPNQLDIYLKLVDTIGNTIEGARMRAVRASS